MEGLLVEFYKWKGKPAMERFGQSVVDVNQLVAVKHYPGNGNAEALGPLSTPALVEESMQRILQKVLTRLGACNMVRAFSRSFSCAN